MANRARVWIGKSWEGSSRLAVIEDIGRGKIRVSSGFQWDEYDEGALFDPMAGISNADELLQAIMDRAWEAGFRPNGYADVKNETAAIRGHLDDLRKIAFHQLKIK